MVEASPAKFYFAKYFFLVFAFIQWVASGTILLSEEFSAPIFFTALLLIALGMLFVFLFFMISDRIRRVAVGKNKIVIIEGTRNIRFDWPDVKSLKIVPVLHLYKLKIKGKKAIYFFPSQNIDPAFGILTKDTSRMGDIVEKRKKELGFK
jgi:hypothetical protein